VEVSRWTGLLYDAQRFTYRGKFAEPWLERDYLAEYAEVFKTVCVSATCYQFPSEQISGADVGDRVAMLEERVSIHLLGDVWVANRGQASWMWLGNHFSITSGRLRCSSQASTSGSASGVMPLLG